MLSIIPREVEHTDNHSPGSSCLHIAVFEPTKYLPPVSGYSSHHCVSPLLAAGFSAGLQQEFKHFDSDSELIVELLLSDLLNAHAGLRHERSRFQPRWLGQLLDYLDDMFPEPWNLDDLAAQVGVHPVYLCRSFRQHFHFTLGQYIRSLRVLRARQLMDEGTVGLAEVAVLSGFSDQSHLQREFKKIVGTSPGLYRRVNGFRRG
jgi:AraC family transcriptional regulator